MHRFELAAALFLSLAGLPSAARASVVYDTFALGDGGNSVLMGQFNEQDLQYAYSFEVPAEAGNAPLDRITVRIRHSPAPEDVPGDFTVRLREDDAGAPGAVLEEWSFTEALPIAMDVVFDSVSQPVLLAGETYWLNMKIDAGTGVGLWLAADPRGENVLFASTGGLNPAWQVPGVFPFLLGLATVEVPEPGQAWLVVAGAAVLAPFLRRRPQT